MVADRSMPGGMLCLPRYNPDGGRQEYAGWYAVYPPW
jgi:hypothetical protein